MSTPRIPPSPSGKREETEKLSESHRHKIGKVGKITEIDDESRAKKFRQFVDQPEEEESKKKLREGIEEAPLPPFALCAPSPKEKKPSAEEKKSKKEIRHDPLPAPSFSPPPAALLRNTVPEEEKDSKDEKTLPGSVSFQDRKRSEQEKTVAPQTVLQSHTEPLSAQEALPPPPDAFHPLSPTTPASIPLAQGPEHGDTPLLSADLLALYRRVVGAIAVMVSPKGDSRMEFVLDSPSFVNSPFYGSTVTIERFSSAPYQLNIELTGSNEAVALFNQNVPRFMDTFRQGNFSYTVQRMSASHKPLFRRRGGAQNQGNPRGS